MMRTASDSLTASVRLAPRRSGRSTPFALEPVLKPRGALRRGILAVAKAALAARSAPQRAVRNEPTPATDKRPAARRVFGEKAVWLRPARECFRSCSLVAARSASFVAPRHPAFSPKTAPLVVSKQALMPNHFHLVLETPRASLIAGMKWVLGTWANAARRLYEA